MRFKIKLKGVGLNYLQFKDMKVAFYGVRTAPQQNWAAYAETQSITKRTLMM